MKIRFSILDLVSLLTVTACIVVAVCHGRIEETTLTIPFAKIPADDSTLEDWLHQHGWQNVEIQRSDDAVVRVSSQHDIFEQGMPITAPPWHELGYTTLGPFSTSHTFSPYFVRDAIPYMTLALVVIGGFQILSRFFQANGSANTIGSSTQSSEPPKPLRI